MTDCEYISLGQAVALWWADQVIADCRLWGTWTVRSLGRLGKVLQFLAAATILVELIGYDRIHRFAEHLRSRPNIRTIAGGQLALLLSGLFGVFGYAIWNFSSWNWIQKIAIALPALLLTAYAGYRMEVFFVRAVGYVESLMASSTLRVRVQTSALLLLVIGFVLDLLAS